VLDQIEYVYLAKPDGQDVAIFGQLPAPSAREGLSDMFQDRPTARKVDQSTLVSIPLGQNTWCLWMLGLVPTVTALPRVLTTIAALSRAYSVQSESVAQNRPIDLAGAEAVLADLPRRRRMNPKVLMARMTAYLVERNACRAVMVLAVKNGLVQKTWGSDETVMQVQCELRAAFVQQMQDGQTAKRVLATSTEPIDFESTMIAQRLGAQSLSFHSAPATSGYGIVLIDPAPEHSIPLVKEVAQALQFSRPISTTPFLTKRRKQVLAGLGAVLGIWLLWPAPIWLTVTGVSVPDSTVTASVSQDATLQQMFVRVGDQVAKDQPIAQLFSAQLEERRAQESLQIKVEELSAQAAMAKNDFGAFQLAEQRGEIAKTRLAQLEARIAELAIKAPVGGLIVAAVPDSNKGAAVPRGSQIAQIQTAPEFVVRLNPARLDARLLTRGMVGQIYFRGLGDRTYALEMITPPVAILDPATRAEKLEAFAKITAADDGRLMGGLSGYARIQGPRQLRIFSLTRYMAEFVRLKAWTYLGLPL
jgi:hypothetical protein